MTDKKTDYALSAVRGATFVATMLIFSIAGYCGAEIYVNPDKCQEKVTELARSCMVSVDDKQKLQCMTSANEMMKSCAQKGTISPASN